MFEIYFILSTVLIAALIRFDLQETKRRKGKRPLCTSFQYGLFTGFLSSAFVILGILFFYLVMPEPQANVGTVFFLLVVFIGSVGLSNIFCPTNKNVRLFNENIFKGFLWLSASLAFFITIGIVVALATDTLKFFEHYSFWDFMWGKEWSPQVAMRADQVGASGKFGSLPLMAGTLLITTIALSVAFPIGLGVAIFTSEFASASARRYIKPLIEILAGVPTVVYGFFAAVTVAPFLKQTGAAYGIVVSSESALGAGLVMGIMIVPYICSLSDDVLNAVPQSLRDGSYALGATVTETILRVTIPAAFPGIVSAFVLGFSRAIGETMIVLMAAGLAGNMTINPLDSVTTFTVQIGTLLTGDQAFDSIKTLSAFALGSALFVTTLILNFIAVRTIHHYRSKYVA